MGTSLSNRPMLEAIRHMPVCDVVTPPTTHLALLQGDARAAVEAAKRMRDWIEAAIAVRYEQRVIAARAAADNTAGNRFQATRKLCSVSRRAGALGAESAHNAAYAHARAGVHRSSVYVAPKRLRAMADAAGLKSYIACPRHFERRAGMCDHGHSA